MLSFILSSSSSSKSSIRNTAIMSSTTTVITNLGSCTERLFWMRKQSSLLASLTTSSSFCAAKNSDYDIHHHHHKLSSSSSSCSSGFLKQSALLRATGTVQQWNQAGAFGFVIDDDTKRRLYVPLREVVFDDDQNPHRKLNSHQRVRYETVQDPTRRDHALMCAKVRDISGRPLSSSSSTTAGNSASLLAAKRLSSSMNNTNGSSAPATTTTTTTTTTTHNTTNSNMKSTLSIFGRNLAGCIVELEGGIGKIQGTTDQLRQHGQFLFSIRRDFVGSGTGTPNNNNASLSFSASGRSNSASSRHNQQRNTFHQQIWGNNNNSNINASSSSLQNRRMNQRRNFLRIGDRVVFDLVADPQRVGRPRIANVRKDQLMSESFF